MKGVFSREGEKKRGQRRKGEEKGSGLVDFRLAFWQAAAMPRPQRADEAGGLYHALNRGNARAVIFHKEGDYEAFERAFAEGLDRYEVELLAYQLMPDHWYLTAINES